jgi:hypothetical protein
MKNSNDKTMRKDGKSSNDDKYSETDKKILEYINKFVTSFLNENSPDEIKTIALKTFKHKRSKNQIMGMLQKLSYY